MRISNRLRPVIIFSCFVISSMLLLGQPSAPAATPEKKPAPEAPTQRLLSAKTVLVTQAGGNTIPYDVIKSTLDGWIRFKVVETADKADLIVEVATSGGFGETQVSSSEGPSMLAGRPERSSRSSADLSNAEIKMTVYDAKNKRVLWSGTQTAKYAIKQTARENNLVEAAEKLASRFHDRLEPPPPKESEQ